MQTVDSISQLDLTLFRFPYAIKSTLAALMQCAFAAQCLSCQRNVACRTIDTSTYFDIIFKFDISGFDWTTKPGMVMLQTMWHQHLKHYKFRSNTPFSLKHVRVSITESQSFTVKSSACCPEGSDQTRFPFKRSAHMQGTQTHEPL